jgi:hypothetical protein
MFELPGAGTPQELRITLDYAQEKFSKSKISKLKVA